MQLPVLLDRSRPDSLTSQLAEQLRDAIRRRRIAGGTRLPSSRQLSEQLSISRNTVVRAYDALVAEGFVDSRPASGIFASRRLPDSPLPPPAAAPVVAADPVAYDPMPVPMLTIQAPNLHNPNRSRLSFDFFPGQPNASLFPLKTWRRLLQHSLSQGGAAGLAHYGDPSGLTALRSAIAGHLAATRGVVVDPNDIVVVSGIQEGINIAASLFLGVGRGRVGRDAVLAGCGLCVPGGRRARRRRAGRRGGPTDGGVARTPRRTALSDALASVSDRARALAPSQSAPGRLGAAQRLLSARGRLRQRLSLRRIAAAGDRGGGARLHDLSRHLLEIARGRAPARLHGRAAAHRRGGPHFEGAAQQRQSLAGAGRARRNDAQRQLSRAPDTREGSLSGESRQSDLVAAAALRRSRTERRRSRAASLLAIAGGCAGCGGARSPRAARAGRRPHSGLGRRLGGGPLAARPARHHPGLRQSGAETDRAGRRAAFRRDRRGGGATPDRHRRTGGAPGAVALRAAAVRLATGLQISSATGSTRGRAPSCRLSSPCRQSSERTCRKSKPSIAIPSRA